MKKRSDHKNKPEESKYLKELPVDIHDFDLLRGMDVNTLRRGALELHVYGRTHS
jgi:hypothetical protein